MFDDGVTHMMLCVERRDCALIHINHCQTTTPSHLRLGSLNAAQPSSRVLHFAYSRARLLLTLMHSPRDLAMRDKQSGPHKKTRNG